ncbi:hypothetical protein AGABI1DRAFT_110930 [Agaricus bisporus var. burnettii JB137-S8]|uniref:Uncharacterized protein n=1 Tax=Agaricus bisporus var. burnettii (strain JB137-S8 / ATCC MYA-4627 / FGSC 10392) TaxID=597362 RepID=K5WBY0_AGABU|nr:uncharacterized protein AGABI1DRAFT_110930 [Agaricus bisporus var. burnettii JB137-S8]EKM84409.1 hypothetical protein AGABI1DRAFT_110930 [Agaricus bisporus var. burnettii JB137-S8]
MKFALFAISIIYTMIALVEASPMPQAPEAGVGGLPDLGGSLGGNAGGTLGGNAGGTGTGNLAGSANGALNGALNGGLGSAVGGLPVVGGIISPPPAPDAPAAGSG